MRSDVCELCGSDEELSVYYLVEGDEEKSAVVCKTCKEMIEDPSKMDEEHFRCLTDSMWSEHKGVQALCYRLFKRMGQHDQADMLYFEDEDKEWIEEKTVDESELPRDSVGNILRAGDSVTIIKDLEVKGAGFTAKRGTVVKNIALNGNPDQIEGRVNGVRIVLLSKFLKKA